MSVRLSCPVTGPGSRRERAGRIVNQVPGERWRPRMGFVDVDGFIRDGYVALRGAVDPGTVAAGRELIWAALAKRGVRRDDRATWPALAEFGDLGAGPFAVARRSPALTAACDELIGPGRWSPPVDVGNAVVVRFPSEDRANAGYHIEGSYAGPDGERWWVNIRSRARGLLALFLSRAARAVPVQRRRAG